MFKLTVKARCGEKEVYVHAPLERTQAHKHTFTHIHTQTKEKKVPHKHIHKHIDINMHMHHTHIHNIPTHCYVEAYADENISELAHVCAQVYGFTSAPAHVRLIHVHSCTCECVSARACMCTNKRSKEGNGRAKEISTKMESQCVAI